MRIDHLIEFNEWKNTTKSCLRWFKIAKMNCWKYLKFNSNHQFNHHSQFKHFLHLLHQSSTLFALSTNRTFVQIVIRIFEIANHSTKIRIVNSISNHDTKIVRSILNHDTRMNAIANQIAFEILNTNSQNTQSRDTQTKIVAQTIFVRWIKLDKHFNQIIKYSSTSHHHLNSTTHSHLQKLFTQKSYQRWINSTRTKKNTRIQRTILILNWSFISINADMLIYQSMRTKKTSH
jgi:hypothetical protein